VDVLSIATLQEGTDDARGIGSDLQQFKWKISHHHILVALSVST